MQYYLAVKEKETMPSAATWMDLQIITLSEGSQTEILLICGIKKNGTNELIYNTETVTDKGKQTYGYEREREGETTERLR